jgi:acyl-CoA thioesterase-1
MRGAIRPGGTRLRTRLLTAAAGGALAGVAAALGVSIAARTGVAAAPGPVVAVQPVARPAPPPDPRPVVAYGDSLTFGWGVPRDYSYPVVLQGLIDQPVIGVGLPGKTSATGLAGLPTVLADDPRAVLLEFGSVDACLGVPMATAEANLDRILTILGSHGIPAVLVGTHVGPDRLPTRAACPNIADYEAPWDAALQTLARRHSCGLVLDVLHGLGAQPDGYHPDAPGYAAMAERLAGPLLVLEATARLPV